MQKKAGYQSKVTKSRAWVVRIPSGVFGLNDTGYGGFQAIVVARNASMAFEIATGCDTWELLEFDVNELQIFPKDPL